MKTWIKWGLVAAGISVVVWILLFIIFRIICAGGCDANSTAALFGSFVLFYGPPLILLVFIITSIIGAIFGKKSEEIEPQKTKTWLKSGLIAAGIITILWIIFLVLTWSTCEGEGCMLFGAAVPIGFFIIILVFIIASIIGAIASKVSKSEGTSTSKGTKIGLWVGIIGVIIYALAKIANQSVWFLNIRNIIDYRLFVPADYLFMGVIFIICLVVGLVIGKLKSK